MSTILIIDDRATNRSVFSRLAASVDGGLSVCTFADPHEALGWLETNVADLIVTDFKMPSMDGAEFTRRVRLRPLSADVPVIVVTAYDDRRFRIRALEAGATDFLLSPVDHSEFRTRVRNLLKLRKYQRQLLLHTQSLERELAESERTRAQVVRESREALAQVIDTVPTLISAVDSEGLCLFANAKQAELTGLSPAALVGRATAELFGPDRAARSLEADRRVFSTGRPIPRYEEEVSGPDGERRVFLTAKSPLKNSNGEVIAVLTTSLDITDRKRAEERLLHMAQHDPLTGLANRTRLGERLTARLQRSRRGDAGLALHVLDLDRFKAVNDVFGHQAGDRLLKAVARRLTAAVKEQDLVARLGGDEFAVLQTGVTTRDEAARLAERLTEAMAQPFMVQGRLHSVGASIGITVAPRDGQTAAELLRNADLALYEAKTERRGTFRFFGAELDTRARNALLLEADLRLAISRGELTLHYQPVLSLRTGKVVGAEALLRWDRPGLGIVGPLDFLQLAEETGLIVPISAWVLEEACRQAAAWSTLGDERLRVAVNLSPSQFRRQDVRDLVLKTLARTGLDPCLLDLEITEGILMQEPQEVASVLRDLRKVGVKFSVDDFGTGYSALASVKTLPVDRLKIDRSFIRNLSSDGADAAIVRAIIGLGHSLGLGVISEGVETAEQVALLMGGGCDELQGFYFSRPLPPVAFEEFVARGRTLPHVV